MKEKGIEDIIKKKFEGFEADVDPSVWSNVQQAIQTPAASPASPSGTAAGTIGMKGFIAIVAAVVGISAAVYFLMPKESEKVPAPKQTENTAANENVPVITTPEKVEASSLTTSAPAAPVVATKKVVYQTTAMARNQIVVTRQSSLPATMVAVRTVEATPSLMSLASAENAHDRPLPEDKSSSATSADDTASDDGTIPAEAPNIPEQTQTFNKGLPNFFSPNGDGVGDVFYIKTRNLVTMDVTVYEESGGKEIYHWNTMDGKWDGNLVGGRPAPEGKYFYTVKGETADGKHCSGQSELTLQRVKRN